MRKGDGAAYAPSSSHDTPGKLRERSLCEETLHPPPSVSPGSLLYPLPCLLLRHCLSAPVSLYVSLKAILASLALQLIQH